MNATINKSGLIYPDLSYSIIGAAMDVHNELGPGWDEWDYHRSMIEALRRKGHKVMSHERKDLVHRGSAVDNFELDLLIDDLIILELKHLKSDFHPKHCTQIINYLMRWEKRLGILINFGLERLSYRRFPHDPVKGTMHYTGKWEELNGQLSRPCKHVKDAVNRILENPGFGYGVRVFKKLLMAELIDLDAMAVRPVQNPAFGALTLGSRELDCILVDLEVLVSVSATGESSAVDLAYLKSYMKQMGVSFGMLIDIGSSDIQLKGVL